MWKYFLRRIALSLLILLGVSALIYLLSMLMPADYIDNQTAAALQSGAMTMEDVQRLKELYGLADKSFTGIIKSYMAWLTSTMKGSWIFIPVWKACYSCIVRLYMDILCNCFYLIFAADNHWHTNGDQGICQSIQCI